MIVPMQEELPPYLDALVVRLLALLQRGQKLVQEGALTAMASLADAAKGHFAKYYDQVGAQAKCPWCGLWVFSAMQGCRCQTVSSSARCTWLKHAPVLPVILCLYLHPS